MKIPAHRRDRYLRDPLPTRVGGIAANLARVASFALSSSNPALVEGLLYESKHFIEWSAPTAPIETASILVELQLALAQWQSRWLKSNTDSTTRDSLRRFANYWLERLLEMSGLLSQEAIEQD